MNKKMLGIVSIGFLVNVASFAQAADFVENVKVLTVTPNYVQNDQPRQECWNEQVAPGYQTTSQNTGSTQTTAANSSDRSVKGAVIGGLAGALLGSQVGQGNGKTAATASGALAGAIIGDRVDNSPQPLFGTNSTSTTTTPTYASTTGKNPQVVQRCRTVQGAQNVVQGYNVSYRYAGRTWTDLLSYNPGVGSTMQVRVNITPQQPANTSTNTNSRY